MVLREALARRSLVEAVPLPKAVQLTEANLLNSENDAKVVTLRARVLGVRENAGEGIIELQSGQRTFLATLLRGHRARDIPVGSIVDVTGVYVGEGSAGQRKVD
jgi:RecJ-like exonuclease